MIYLESATPAVDRPSLEVDGKEVDKVLLFHLSTLARSPAATLPLLLSFTRNTAYTTKRNNNDEIQYIQTMEGTQFPKD
jgi:hypothetical protein